MSAQWELLAIRPGGSVTSLTSTNGRVFAATPAGFRYSSDSGRSWSAVGGMLAPPMELVVPSPTFASTGVVLAGTATGLHASANGGRNWRPVLEGSRVLAIAFVDDQLLLVGTEQDGILRSDDAGKTWTSANPGLLDLTVLALACSPAVDTDQTVVAATSSGLFWSRNTGRTWRSVDTLPGEPAVQCLAFSPGFASDGVVVAGTEADGLFRSTDGGATWHSAEALAARSVTALSWSAPGRLAAATDTGVALSHDGGGSWGWAGSELGPVLTVAFAPDGGVLAGVPRGGVMRSSDFQAWYSANEGLRANLLVALTVGPEGALCIAGLEDGIAVSRDGGVSWESTNAGLEAAGVAVFGLSAGSSRLYAATSGGIFSTGARDWQRVHPSPARAICADDRRILAAGLAPELLLSQDAGETWRTLELPPGIGQPTCVALGRPSTLMVGSNLGIWRSSDGGPWQRVQAAALPGTLTVLVLSPTFTQDRTLLAGTSAGACISRDAGATFQTWSEGMGERPVVAMAFSPAYATNRETYGVELGGRIWLRHDHALA